MKLFLSLAIGASLFLLSPDASLAGAQIMPVLDTDFPDPFVLPVGDELFAFATNGRHDGKSLNVQMSHSSDGVTWSPPEEAMPHRPNWARYVDPDIWAPEVIKVGDKYVLYFSARHKLRRRPDGLTLCIGAAVSSSPEGPYVPQPRPLTCGGVFGVIDVSPFRDGDRLWVYLKADGNCCGAAITILAQPLSEDGLALDGKPQIIAGLTNDAPWEGQVIEAPEMRMHGGRYYMFYAANDYGSAAYATGYAVCMGPLGPCQDAPGNPILKSDIPDGLIGPGHESVFEWKGKTFIAFHGWRDNDDAKRRYRAMYIRPLIWTDEGPVVDLTP